MNRFPANCVTYHHMLDASLDVPRFRRFIGAVMTLGRTSCLLECNRSWIGENVTLDGKRSVKLCEESVARLAEAGWGSAAASALYHAVEDTECLRQAMVLAFPDAVKMTPEETVKELARNCVK